MRFHRLKRCVLRLFSTHTHQTLTYMIYSFILSSFTESIAQCSRGYMTIDSEIVLEFSGETCNRAKRDIDPSPASHLAESQLDSRSSIDMCPRAQHDVIASAAGWVVEKASTGAGHQLGPGIYISDNKVSALAYAVTTGIQNKMVTYSRSGVTEALSWAHKKVWVRASMDGTLKGYGWDAISSLMNEDALFDALTALIYDAAYAETRVNTYDVATVAGATLFKVMVSKK